MPLSRALNLLDAVPHVRRCCFCLSLRTGCILASWCVVAEGLLIMCGLLELEGEEEKRRSNLTNGLAGTLLFLMGVMAIGGASERKPVWLQVSALMILVSSVGLVVNAAITFVRRQGNMTLYLMSALLGPVLYIDLVMLSLSAELREEARREREETARLSSPPFRLSQPDQSLSITTSQ